MKICFVCTQNVFRSFSAERILRKLAEDKKIPLRVVSAGVRAYPDNPYPYTVYRLQELGINTDGHQQVKVSKKLLDSCNIIIAMTHSHKNHCQKLTNQPVFLLNEIAYGKSTDLMDDEEADANGELKDLPQFVKDTVDYIFTSMTLVLKGIYDFQMKNALEKISNINGVWRLEGTANLYAQNISVYPKDLDITCDKNALQSFSQVLGVVPKRHPTLNGNKIDTTINGLPIEIIHYEDDELNYFEYITEEEFKGVKTNTLPLEQAKAFYVKINKQDKVNIIENFLNKK